jgi:hypothetical protein
MDSIIEDSTNNHISLLKVILFILGKDINLNKDYKILELNNIFKDISKEELIYNKIPPQYISQEDEKDDDENNSNSSQLDDEAEAEAEEEEEAEAEEEEEYDNVKEIKVENNSKISQEDD